MSVAVTWFRGFRNDPLGCGETCPTLAWSIIEDIVRCEIGLRVMFGYRKRVVVGLIGVNLRLLARNLREMRRDISKFGETVYSENYYLYEWL